jgi:ABC-type polysaccharide/polyol phosphate export permease
LIFAQASNESRPIWFILYNFGLWVLFEVGIIRSALVLNTFKDLRRDLKASSLLVSSAAYLSNLFDFFPIALIIFSYSLFISDMSVRSWLFTALAFLSAYLVLFLPALLLSFGAAWLNRNHRDFKHILPWIIRIFIFTTPIFDIGYSGHFMTVQSILEFSPLSFPFNVLQMPVEGVQAIEPQMIIGFILTSLALLLVYKDRATRE